MRTLLSIVLFSCFVLCGSSRIEASDPWQSTLSSLPADLRQCLVDRFDCWKDFRQQRPDLPVPKEEMSITDDRAKFAAGCDIGPGFSHVLLVRAKAVRNFWVIQYEVGGLAERTEVIVLTRDSNGVFHEAVRPFIGVDKNDADEVAKALDAETPVQNSEPAPAPSTPASGKLARQP